MSEETELQGICTCKLCGVKIAGPMGAVRLINSGHPTTSTGQYLLALATHVMTAHPRQDEALMLAAGAYIGMLRMFNFRTTDKSIARSRDELRWSVLQQVIDARVSDKTIEEKSKVVAEQLMNDLKETLLGQFYPPGGPGTEPAIISRLDPFDVSVSIVRRALETVWNEMVLDIQDAIVPVLKYFRDEMQEPGKYTPTADGIIRDRIEFPR